MLIFRLSSPGSRGVGGEQRLRLDEDLAVEVVEPADDLARQLEVRHLILSHRHPVRVVDHDIGGLEQRVAEKADARQIAVAQLLDLLLVGRHALEPRNRRHHLQQQVELGVLRHHRLHEEGALLGIEAGANPVGDVVERGRDDLAGVGVVRRQGMPVDDAVEAVELGLKVDPVLKSADQMTQMQLAGRAHARHHALSCQRSHLRMAICTGLVIQARMPVSISA